MKIGIITLYYNSKNYGGVLQAYALCKAIERQISEKDSVEQICYIAKKNSCFQHITKWIKSGIKFFFPNKRKQMLLLEKRDREFKNFTNKFIKHSKKVYTKNNIIESVEDYDIFIAGSDQVWNPIIYDEVYRLDFVPKNKIKISYAASVSQYSLNDSEKDIFTNTLSGYKGISVREDQAITILQPLTNNKVNLVLDPTLLLSVEEWDSLATKRFVKEKYIFVYFLDVKFNKIDIIKDIAINKGWKIVNIAHINFNSELYNISDICLPKVSPQQFISLIKYAECVFTDSFHATVFSNIYKKNFYVFRREEYSEMAVRIESLLKIFENENRFLDSEEKLTKDYLKSIEDMCYQRNKETFNDLKETSLNFLFENLGIER